jgi:hypothetical protein
MPIAIAVSLALEPALVLALAPPLAHGTSQIRMRPEFARRQFSDGMPSMI